MNNRRKAASFLSRFRGLSGPRRRLFLGLAVLVVVALGALLVPRLFDKSIPVDTSKLGTVLLIPGYGGNQDSLRTLADRVRQTGREAVVVALPGDGTGDLLEQVSVLDREVSAAYQRGAPSVDLIGYSAGGVVARLWVARADQKARRVVTLGSPLHGTRLAAGGNTLVPDACPVACRQLATGSSLLASFARQPVPVPWLSIWTDLDQTVIPPDSARLDGAVNVSLQSICPNSQVTHSGLPADPLVGLLVLRAISLAELSQPTAADCV